MNTTQTNLQIVPEGKHYSITFGCFRFEVWAEDIATAETQARRDLVKHIAHSLNFENGRRDRPFSLSRYSEIMPLAAWLAEAA